MPAELPVIEPFAASDSPTGPVRFHLSLNVDDLARSIAFFTVLFDRPPAKHERDYAKFELDEPALVLSLEPNRTPAGGKLNHLGFRLASAESLVALQCRLEMAGIASTREEGVECCYARQTKFWVTDPDGNLWEMYTLEEDLDHRGIGQAPRAKREQKMPGGPSDAPAPAVWAHRLGEKFPSRILVHDGDADQVFLQGTFNACLTSDQRRAMLAEVVRVLKPGGEVLLHQLTARTPLPTLNNRLPGPAAAVEAVPSAAEIAADLQAAGFVRIEFDKLGDGPCFEADGVECRETRLVGYRPSEMTSNDLSLEVLYKGPFRQITDDQGRVYQRGEWTKVDAATRDWLQASALAGQFVLPQ